MSLEQAINDNTIAVRELAEAIRSSLAGTSVVNTTGAPAAEEKKGRGRPPKEKTEAATETKQPDPPAEEDPFADASDPVPEKTYTTDDVRKALIDLSKKDKPKATSILAGCTNKDGKPAASIGEILPADYARVVKEATEALK